MIEKIKELFLQATGFSKIDFLEKMNLGYSNCVYKVVSEGKEYKVRLGQHNHLIDRQNEYAILMSIPNNGCIFYQLENGNSVWNWTAGNSSTKEIVTRTYLEKLIRIVEQIHSMNFFNLKFVREHDDLEFLDRTSQYLQQEDLEIYLELVNRYRSTKKCLCHNDISLSNLIYCDKTKNLQLIDYEWGRINSPYWDYGNCIKELDLSWDNLLFIADEANLNVKELSDYCFLASLYSIQLSYIFPDPFSDNLRKYRNRLFLQLNKYRRWLKR